MLLPRVCSLTSNTEPKINNDDDDDDDDDDSDDRMVKIQMETKD